MASLTNYPALWSNAACLGYYLEAVRRAGADPETARMIYRELRLSFDELTLAEAEEVYNEYMTR